MGRRAVRFSVTLVATDRGPRVADIARAVEELGLDGLWIPDHTHIPVSRDSPYPLGGELPDRYRRNLEALSAVAMAAAATSRIRVGTGVLLAALRDPIVTAKALATIDQQSGGRVAVGVGYGWNREEMLDHRVDPATRRARTREHVLAMRNLWEREIAGYDGGFVSIAPSWSWPKPAQRPHPPIILGGETDHTLRRVIEYCDGWFPRPRGGFDVVQGVARLRQMAQAKGRDPATLMTIVFGAPNDAKVLESYEKAGIEGALLAIPDDSPDDILRYLDKIAPLAKVGVPA